MAATAHRIAVLVILGVLLLDAHGQETAGEAGPNIISNPGFEEMNAEGWPTDWSGPTSIFSLSKENPRSGKQCLRYENRDAKKYVMFKAPLKLEPGRRYAIEGWVRTKEVEGDDTGATICIEFYGPGNAFLGGCYPAGIKGTNAEWHRIDSISRRVPEEAVRCHFLCYLRKGMTGIAWWDDVSVRVYRGPLIEAMTTSRYRGETAGGPVVVKTGLNLADYDLTASQIETRLCVKTMAGREVRTILGEVEDDKATFSFNASPLAPDDYVLECVVASKDGTVRARRSCSLKRFAEPPKRKAYIDEHLRLILDGEPFFPLGLYCGRAKKSDLEIIAESPFNCLMPYGSPNGEELDNAQACGIRIIYSVKDYYAGTKYCPQHIKTEADERPAIEKKVAEVKDHPAVMAWYINDELPLSMIDRLNAHRDWLQELDPQRPTWVVLYQKDQVRDYLDSFDVIGSDPYPIPERPAGMALEYTRKTVSGVFGLRAVWMVPQIFNWAWYPRRLKEGVEYRAPTLLEMRSMAWQCIAGGANGLIFYSYATLHRVKEEPFEVRWKDITAMAGEIKTFTPVLLSVEAVEPPVRVDAPEAVAWRLYRKDGRVYLVTVNSGDEPATAQFQFAAPWAGMEVLMGEKDVTWSGAHVQVPFSLLEPKVICLTSASSQQVPDVKP